MLLFDRRGEGASDGDPNTLGWAGTRDVDAAISFLQARPDVDGDRIGGLGLGRRGGAPAEAAETDDLKAVVSEGAGIRSVREAVDLTGSERWFAVPVFALVTGAAIFASDLPPPGLKELSAEISAPVFFIYATPGQGGESLSRTFYEAANQPKQIWAARAATPGRSHEGALGRALERVTTERRREAWPMRGNGARRRARRRVDTGAGDGSPAPTAGPTFGFK